MEDARRQRQSQPKTAVAAEGPEGVEVKEREDREMWKLRLPLDALADEVTQVGGVGVLHHGELVNMLASIYIPIQRDT